MFLLRCLFWLGLVFSQISQQEGTRALTFAAAASEVGGRAADLAVNAAEQNCRAEPASCLALAAQAALPRSADARPPSPRGGIATSQDNLSAADRVPSWRLGRDKTLTRN